MLEGSLEAEAIHSIGSSLKQGIAEQHNLGIGNLWHHNAH